jgi:flagellar hook-length control protein FliK
MGTDGTANTSSGATGDIASNTGTTAGDAQSEQTGPAPGAQDASAQTGAAATAVQATQPGQRRGVRGVTGEPGHNGHGHATRAHGDPVRSTADGAHLQVSDPARAGTGTGARDGDGVGVSGRPAPGQDGLTQPAATAPAATNIASAAATDPDAPAMTATMAPGSASAPGAAQTAAIRPGVGLERMAETVRLTVELAARRGYSQARIQLSPEALGDVRVHLHQTGEGIVARLVAASAAAHTLQQASHELRRSLQSAGISLLSLDINVADHDGAAHRDSAPAAPRAAAGRATGGTTDVTHEQPTSATTGRSKTVTLHSGVVIDVLA